MTPGWIGALYGVLVASAILIIALLISTPDGVTLALAVAIGAAVGVATWYRERRR